MRGFFLLFPFFPDVYTFIVFMLCRGRIYHFAVSFLYSSCPWYGTGFVLALESSACSIIHGQYTVLGYLII